MCSDTGMSQKQTLLDILQKKCTWKFRNIHRTIPAPESIFDKAWYDPQPATKDVCNFIQKNDFGIEFFGEFCKILIKPFSQSTSRRLLLNMKI